MSKSILIVDDEKEFTSLVAQMLKMRMYNTVEVNSGREALDILAKSRFDLMTLDINMPEMNGIEVARSVNQKYPDLKIIIISGFGSKYDDDLPTCKIAKILPKPITFEVLISTAKELLG